MVSERGGGFMSKANDFFYKLPGMLEQAGHADRGADIKAMLTTLIENQCKILECIADLNDRHQRIIDTVYEICPGLMVIEEVAESDDERKMLLRKYMHTAVDSEDEEDILDWIIAQENKHDD